MSSNNTTLQPCIVCNNPVSADCRCRVCGGPLHCFCALPEGLEGHGAKYRCSAACHHGGAAAATSAAVGVTEATCRVGAQAAALVADASEEPVQATVGDAILAEAEEVVQATVGDAVLAEAVRRGDAFVPIRPIRPIRAEVVVQAVEGVLPVWDDLGAAAEAAFLLLKSHPLKQFERLNTWSRSKVLAVKQQDISSVTTFVAHLCNLPSCFDRNNRHFTGCDCLSVIEPRFFPSVARLLGEC
jgi:hypothetical protein